MLNSKQFVALLLEDITEHVSQFKGAKVYISGGGDKDFDDKEAVVRWHLSVENEGPSAFLRVVVDGVEVSWNESVWDMAKDGPGRAVRKTAVWSPDHEDEDETRQLARSALGKNWSLIKDFRVDREVNDLDEAMWIFPADLDIELEHRSICVNFVYKGA